jgi:chemotaxis protein MotB
LYSRHRSQESSLNVWPGFVDALTALVVVLMFVVLVFVISQYYLSTQLSGQSQSAQTLTEEVKHLNQALNAQEREQAKLKATYGALLHHAGELSQSHDELSHVRSSLEEQIAALQERLAKLTQLLESKSAEHDRNVTQLTHSLESKSADYDHVLASKESLEAQLARLTSKLDKTLEAEKISGYKSEFFGRLREALNDRSGMVVVGDRFMFQSEVLFPSASAELEVAGEVQLAILARSLKEVIKTLPQDLNWILRIDGHTDNKPIHNSKFASNWELSAARAMSVVSYLIAQGIPPHRLAATGFGEYQPLSLEEKSRNRRIELRIDQR